MTQPSDPINPQPERKTTGLEGNYGYNPPSNGITKREYFAALAMQGFMANTEREPMTDATAVEFCVRIADALIAELNKEKQ